MESRFALCPKCKNPIYPWTRYKVEEGQAEHVNCLTWDKPNETVGKEFKGPKSGYIGH